MEVFTGLFLAVLPPSLRVLIRTTQSGAGMRVIYLCLCFVLLALAMPPAWAESSPGVAAYERKDFKAALPLLEKEAAAGDPVAQTKLGLIYAKGLDVPKDPKIALPWFEKAAAQGHAEAEYCLGVAHDFGDGIPQDQAEAAIWYRKAAEKGYLKAQTNLAYLLERGEGVPKDLAQSASWYTKAAEQGEIDSQNYVAHLYLKGIGVERNILTARIWIDRAAAQGDPTAKKGAAYLAEEFEKLEKEGASPRLAGGDGSSTTNAISFPLVKLGHDGVNAEHKVTNFFFNGWTWDGQSLINDAGRAYDAIEMSKNGQKRVVYFEVTKWFGILE